MAATRTNTTGRPRHETACIDCGKHSRSVSVEGASLLARRHADSHQHTVLTGELQLVGPAEPFKGVGL